MPNSNSITGSNLSEQLVEKLRRHPKRVVFAEGEDVRVLEVASRLVAQEAIAPILLGNRERIRAMAEEHSISLKFVHIIDPPRASDFALFCQRVDNINRYRNTPLGKPEEIVARPHYFGALMVQYGQADAIVGGNQAIPATYFRALLNTIKPLPEVPKTFGLSLLTAPHLQHMGSSGILMLADTAFIPSPSIDELSSMAIESGKLAHHLLGRTAHVAMLSHSTKGSAATPSAKHVAAATANAQAIALKQALDIHIEGEVQADVALDPTAAEIKLPAADIRPTADVLIFPNLDAAHISLKLLTHVAGASTYGKLIMGLARPAAQVPRTASTDTIYGTALIVAIEAIKYHQLYPDGEV